MAEIHVYTGPHRSSRAEALNAAVLENWGGARLLVPTRRYAAQRTADLIEQGALPGVWRSPVLTFQEFALGLLAGTKHEQMLIGTFEQRILLKRVVDAATPTGLLDFLESSAETDGFLTHLHRLIGQLKQAGVDPDSFRETVCKRPGSTVMDTAVAVLYEGYQDSLRASGAYDLQGMYWLAKLLCEEGKPAALESVATLALDDFDDFTPSEFSLIHALESHLEQLIFGLNYDPSPGRADAYALPIRTARRISEAFNAALHTFDDTPPTSQAAFASSNIFWRDQPSPPVDLTHDIELLPCHSPSHEIEAVGRRIKQLVTSGEALPAEIAVVCRDLPAVSATIDPMFREFGIPYVNVQSPSLFESAFGAFLLVLYDALDGWHRGAVLDAISSRWFRRCGEADEDSGGAYPLLARHAPVIAGRNEWLKRVQNLSRRLSETGSSPHNLERLCRQLPGAPEYCASLLRQLEALAEIDESLPSKSTTAGHAGALDAVLAGLASDEAIDGLSNEDSREFEREAVRSAVDLLGVIVRWYADDNREISRNEFALSLRQALKATPSSTHSDPGGVAVLDPQSVRRLRFSTVFFVGLNEGTLPRRAPSSAIYAEEDLARLRRADIELDDAKTHANREQLLFLRALDVSSKKIILCWHEIGADGKQKLPSPFVQDIRELFGGLPAGRAVEMAPELDAVASWRDLQNAVFAHNLSIPKSTAAFEAACAGADIEAQRHSDDPFGPHDGVLRAPGLLGDLEERFGPEHTYSANQLETYVSCPFRFFTNRVLHIEEEERPDEAFDPKLRGTILHAILESFHRRFCGKSVSDISEGEATEAMEEIVKEKFEGNLWKSASARSGIARVEQARMNALMSRYLRIARGVDDSGLKPSHFEVAFGLGPSGSGEFLTKAEPFTLETSAGPVAVSGRIDRIDCAEDQAYIVDYKSSQPVAKKEIVEGRSLQLTLYALALEAALMPGSVCEEAVFMRPGTRKIQKGMERKKKDGWEERLDTARTVIGEAVTAMRGGRFHPTSNDKSCAYCPKAHVCRYERSRMERKGA